MILMIDNYDSFTYNLVQYLGEIGEEVKVVRNDQIGINEIKALEPDHIVISPRPLYAERGGGFVRNHHRARRQNSHFGSVSWSSKYRPSLRWQDRQSPRCYAW